MKKEKFVTEIKKSDFKQTCEALSELSQALADLNIALNSQNNSSTKELKAKSEELKAANLKIENLKKTTLNSIKNIDKVINRLDIALEENGTGNNNN